MDFTTCQPEAKADCAVEAAIHGRCLNGDAQSLPKGTMYEILLSFEVCIVRFAEV